MNKITVILFLFCSNILFGQEVTNDLLNEVVYNGNVSLLDNLIEPEQLISFSCNELTILRNMIYAKHNYSFTDNELREYFSQFAWYNGTEKNVESSLTYIDHRNIRYIRTFENNYPFLTYYDENLFNRKKDWKRSYHYTNGELIIMGWSMDDKIFYWSNIDGHFSDEYHYGIFDLRENKTIWSKNVYYMYGYGNHTNDTINEIFEFVSNEYNIIPQTEYIHTNIEGYSVYSKRTGFFYYDEYILWNGFEVGLRDSDDNIISLINMSKHEYAGGNLFFGNDLMLSCIRSPFNEDIILLIGIVEFFQGGDLDGFRTHYYFKGIDLGNLY